MCELSLKREGYEVSIFTGRGAVESPLNSGARKIKLWGEDRSGRAKCEMRGSGKEIMAPTQKGGGKRLDILNATSLSLSYPA